MELIFDNHLTRTIEILNGLRLKETQNKRKRSFQEKIRHISVLKKQ
jgi:hypothetical protein